MTKPELVFELLYQLINKTTASPEVKAQFRSKANLGRDTIASKDRGKTAKRSEDQIFIKKTLNSSKTAIWLTVQSIDFRYDDSVLKNQ